MNAKLELFNCIYYRDFNNLEVVFSVTELFVHKNVFLNLIETHAPYIKHLVVQMINSGETSDAIEAY